MPEEKIRTYRYEKEARIMLRRVSSSEAREEFSEIINRVAYTVGSGSRYPPAVFACSPRCLDQRDRAQPTLAIRARAYNLDSLDVF